MNFLKLLVCAGLVASAVVISPLDSRAQSGPPPIPELMELLTGYLFQDTNFLSIWGDQPLSQTNLALVPTWDYYGLQVDATNAAWLSYTFESDGYPNLFLTNATISCWLVPNWISSGLGGTGSGVWSRIIDVGQWTSNASYGWFSLFTDPTGDNIFFSAQSNNGTQTNYLTAPIAWDGTTWHQIVLTYSASSTCLYLDGVLATNGPGISILPPPEALSNGFYVLSDQTGVQQFHGQADRLWIYGNQETDTNEIASDYAYYNAFANPPPHIGPLGDDDPPSPDGGSGGTNSGSGPTANGIYNPPYGSNQFWLQILPVGTNAYNTDTNSVTLILWGTIADIDYQIQMTTNIQTSNVVWTVAGDALGSEVTNFTATTVSMLGLPTVYFRALPASLDSDGDGLPDWWEIKYSTADFPLSPTNADTGNTGILDGYKQDSAGDGYNNLQKYQMGIPPNVFVTPPAPSSFTSAMNTNGNVIFSWSAAPNLPSSGAGSVVGYTLSIYDPIYGDTNIITLGANQLSYDLSVNYEGLFGLNLAFPEYEGAQVCSLQVNYANTNSAWATNQLPTNPNNSVAAYIVRGPQGALYLTASAIPKNVIAIRVYYDWGGMWYPLNDFGLEDWQGFQPPTLSNPPPPYIGSYASVSYFDLPVTNLTNGIYQLPYWLEATWEGGGFTEQGVGSDGSLGDLFTAVPTNDWNANYQGGVMNIPFMDGRTNIQQNINMLLRGADSSNTFNIAIYPQGTSLSSGGDYSYVYSYSGNTNYVYSGYSFNSAFDLNTYDLQMGFVRNEFEPFEDNALYTNFVYTSGEFDTNGNFTNALGHSPWGDALANPASTFQTFNYVSSFTNYVPITPLLDETQSQWILSPSLNFGGVYDGCVANGDGTYTLTGTYRNLYGLQFQSVKYLGTNHTYETATAGVPFDFVSFDNWFHETEQPALQTIGYYFARPAIDSVPGAPNFSVTNTPLTPIIVPVGQPVYLAAWAEQIVTNGYSNVRAYPQQYFDQAFLCDTNGDMTTNQTGILSEYGEFFPTAPGKVILTTKPDGATGATAQCPLYVIKLQFDVNHDGTMDTSWAGPDNTSSVQPFHFWVNNDCDYSSGSGDPGHDIDDTNCINYNSPNIPSQRDLEDWARLWICGLSALPTGCQVTLSWTNIQSGSPAVNLVMPVETNGGTLYLTDTNVAALQVSGTGTSAPSYKFARITPTNSYTFPDFALLENPTNFFLFEGAGIGNGELLLTITQGTNVIATAGAFMDLHDIKDFYEQPLVTNVYQTWPQMVQQLTNSNFLISSSWLAEFGSAKQLAVFVHGWNMPQWTYYNFSETMLKRLYWKGFQGRFASLRWPTRSKDTDTNLILNYIPSSLFTYNRSEHIAFMSGRATAAYLTNLQSRFPDYTISVCAHSMGNIVMMEALKELAASNQTPIDNYVLMQAAVPAHCFDPTVTNYPLFTNDEQIVPTPNTYSNYAATITNALQGKAINFFNPVDFALGQWVNNQGFFFMATNNGTNEWLTIKPNDFFGYSYDAASGVSQVTTNTWQLVVGETNVETRTVTDPLELMPFVARPRSLAVGAQSNVDNVLSVSQQLNLQATLGFTDAIYDHSGEFNRNIQTPQVQGFYTNLVSTLFPP